MSAESDFVAIMAPAVAAARDGAATGREPSNLMDVLFLADCTLGDIVEASRRLDLRTVPELAAARAQSGLSRPEFIAPDRGERSEA